MKTRQKLDNPFASFLMGGYECCDMINRFGNRVDLLRSSGHLENCEDDYSALKEFGIKSVREGIRWSVAEPQPYKYDWSDFDRLCATARHKNIQQIWDLCHFGMPADLTPMHPNFTARFQSFCTAFALHYREFFADMPLLVIPINEISFFSWLGGEVGGTTPYTLRLGWDVKYRLTKACIAGIKAIREIIPDALMITAEPLVSIVSPLNAFNEKEKNAAKLHEEQYQVTDMLLGRICPELGGDDSLIDIIGYNYYYNNQFCAETNAILPWGNEFRDPRFRPVSDLLFEGYNRYGKPIFLAETSHPGEHRAQWFEYMLRECRHVMNAGLPLLGMCWYPILDRCDWDFEEMWHRSGLWSRCDTGCENSFSIDEPLAETIRNLLPVRAEKTKTYAATQFA